jgi:uracil-DNA glycosylase family 4
MKTDHPLPQHQFNAYPSCTLCSLHEGAKTPGMPTRLLTTSSPNTPPLIVVGNQPTATEEEIFTGSSGTLLTNVYLKHEELLKHTIYLTNATRCSSLGNNEQPKNKHFKACFPYLLKDIKDIMDFHTQKAYVLCLGSHAYSVISQYFLGKRHSLRHGLNNQGQPSTSLLPNQLNIYSTFHPAAVMREKKYLYPVSDHIELLVNAINGRAPTPSLPDIQEPSWPKEIS